MAINELIMRTSDAKKPLSTRKCLRSTMRGGGGQKEPKNWPSTNYNGVFSCL